MNRLKSRINYEVKMRKHEKSQTKKWIQKPIANNQSNYELKIGLRFWRTFNNQEKETNNLEPEKERSEVQLAKLKIDSPNLTIGQGNSIWVEVRRCVKWIWRSRRSSQKFPVFPPKWGPTWWPGFPKGDAPSKMGDQSRDSPKILKVQL